MTDLFPVVDLESSLVLWLVPKWNYTILSGGKSIFLIRRGYLLQPKVAGNNCLVLGKMGA
jgi:hypothetical protein